MISKTRISAQKLCKRQLNAKVCGSKSAIFVILSSLRPLCSNNGNSKTVQVLTIILSQNWCLSQRGAIQPLSVFIAPNSRSCSRHCLGAVCYIGRHFQMLYACTNAVSFPNQRPRLLVWERDWCTSEIAALTSVDYGWHSISRGSGQGLCCAYHLGKVLYLAAYI